MGFLIFDKLEQCIAENFKKIESFRNRDIFSLEKADEKDIKDLFIRFLKALEIDSVEARRRSPVAVAKALHILAPNFFPLWDKAIARSYGFNFKKPSEDYFSFCHITREILAKIKNYIDKPSKPLLRLIDEYNYSKYTKRWIK